MNVVVSINNYIEPGILNDIRPCGGKLGTTMATKHLTFKAKM